MSTCGVFSARYLYPKGGRRLGSGECQGFPGLMLSYYSIGIGVKYMDLTGVHYRIEQILMLYSFRKILGFRQVQHSASYVACSGELLYTIHIVKRVSSLTFSEKYGLRKTDIHRFKIM